MLKVRVTNRKTQGDILAYLEYEEHRYKHQLGHAEGWTIKGAEYQRTDAFELWF